jgi:hypothetical protein
MRPFGDEGKSRKRPRSQRFAARALTRRSYEKRVINRINDAESGTGARDELPSLANQAMIVLCLAKMIA